ncbi:hypothetical protein [Nocardia sp. NBC_01329]|uniref:hypothetical protein n=1 Tax=Nocardia sp. NBC_01329 TaxID=2903594 RepID=UPI002E10B134|nr:hypothetical protein OG405_03740 [Nocardia sp. NBC_01329]
MTTAGIIGIGAVDTVAATALTDDDARAAGYRTRPELCATFRGRVSDPIFRIAVHFAGPDPREALAVRDDLDVVAVAALHAQLGAVDHRAAQPWTRQTLGAIARKPGEPAADLAHSLDQMPAEQLKRRVRKLKALGLTVSLARGYALSSRGRKYWDLSNEGRTAP